MRHTKGASQTARRLRDQPTQASGGRPRAAAGRPDVHPAPKPIHPGHPSHPTQLDRLIHDRMRLAILAALAATESLTFTDLKSVTGATDGNLSVHARRLEEAGYVQCTKAFAGRTPRTDYRLSAAGRRALEKYLDHMDALIKATRKL